jgi:hypothetical protein
VQAPIKDAHRQQGPHLPPKSEWPTLTDAEWASNRRHAFLKFKRLLLSMFTALDFVVGNENYGGEWALIYDTAARKAHKTYPPPTSAPRRRPACDGGGHCETAGTPTQHAA